MEGDEQQPIVVTHAAAVTALGVDLASIWLALSEKTVLKQKKIKLELKHEETINHLSVGTYPIRTIQSRVAEARASQMLSLALAETLTDFNENFDPRRVLLYLLLPSETEARAKKIQADNLWDAVDWAGPKVKFMPRCFGDVGMGATDHLLSACEALWQNETDAVIFGGIDSLVDKATLKARAEKELLTEYENNDIVGEAAAMVVLRRSSDYAHPKESALVLGGLANGSIMPPVQPKQDARVQTSLVWEALNEAQFNREHIDCVLKSGSIQKNAIEAWSLLQKEIWPKPRMLQVVDKSQPFVSIWPAIKLQIIHIAHTLGDIGAAMLPLSLSLGWAGFRYHKWSQGALLLDEMDTFSRGAVVLAPLTARLEEKKPS